MYNPRDILEEESYDDLQDLLGAIIHGLDRLEELYKPLNVGQEFSYAMQEARLELSILKDGEELETFEQVSENG